LDISANIMLKQIILEDMSSLYKVCVWTMPFPPAGVEIVTTNCPNMFFTTGCSK